ncbi:uncharacterized protein BJX67DRAFT_343049 [Aspergillus lucknowensis]|uniref:Uncharacterized protein n=1 Tax=Aspergillus lucknowensis TaxID=176173 RepID=A0ABR4M324_9EURO
MALETTTKMKNNDAVKGIIAFRALKSQPSVISRAWNGISLRSGTCQSSIFFSRSL